MKQKQYSVRHKLAEQKANIGTCHLTLYSKHSVPKTIISLIFIGSLHRNKDIRSAREKKLKFTNDKLEICYFTELIIGWRYQKSNTFFHIRLFIVFDQFFSYWLLCSTDRRKNYVWVCFCTFFHLVIFLWEVQYR